MQEKSDLSLKSESFRRNQKHCMSRKHPVKKRKTTISHIKTNLRNEGDSSSFSQEYEVEKILKKRIIRSRVEYLVKWKRYTESDATWEPIENLTNCQKLIDQFEKSTTIHNRINKPIDTEIIGVKYGEGGKLIYKARNIQTLKLFEILPEDKDQYTDLILDYLHQHIKFK